MVARLESSGRRWWSWWWWTLASADPAQAHVGEGKYQWSPESGCVWSSVRKRKLASLSGA